jgi:hypothetical protein
MIMSDFIEKGFTHTFDYEILKHIREEDLRNPNEWLCDDHGMRYPSRFDLTNAMDYIRNKYVYPLFGENEKGYNDIWNHSEPTVLVWHNDLKEGPNLFFLYYLTDVYKGGEIRFRVNGKETGHVQPRVGLLVMGSHESHVEHKVEPTLEDRIVSNYGFYVKSYV